MIREIVAKTLTGRGKVPYFFEKEISLGEDVSKTLGCWIINLNYDISYDKNDVYLEGNYSIQLWYAKDNDKTSSVYEEKILFKEKVMMAYRNLSTISDEKTVKVFVNKYPNAIYMKLNDDKIITLKIEGLFFIDVFQEALLVIDTKDNVKPELTLDEELLLNVNTNYLLEKNEK